MHFIPSTRHEAWRLCAAAKLEYNPLDPPAGGSRPFPPCVAGGGLGLRDIVTCHDFLEWWRQQRAKGRLGRPRQAGRCFGRASSAGCSGRSPNAVHAVRCDQRQPHPKVKKIQIFLWFLFSKKIKCSFELRGMHTFFELNNN